MAHHSYCDYRPKHLIGVSCICEFIDEIRKRERQIIAKRIGTEVLHQKGEGKFALCKGCGQWPCELDGEQ